MMMMMYLYYLFFFNILFNLIAGQVSNVKYVEICKTVNTYWSSNTYRKNSKLFNFTYWNQGQQLIVEDTAITYKADGVGRYTIFNMSIDDKNVCLVKNAGDYYIEDFNFILNDTGNPNLASVSTLDLNGNLYRPVVSPMSSFTGKTITNGYTTVSAIINVVDNYYGTDWTSWCAWMRVSMPTPSPTTATPTTAAPTTVSPTNAPTIVPTQFPTKAPTTQHPTLSQSISVDFAVVTLSNYYDLSGVYNLGDGILDVAKTCIVNQLLAVDPSWNSYPFNEALMFSVKLNDLYDYRIESNWTYNVLFKMLVQTRAEALYEWLPSFFIRYGQSIAYNMTMQMRSFTPKGLQVVYVNNPNSETQKSKHSDATLIISCTVVGGVLLLALIIVFYMRWNRVSEAKEGAGSRKWGFPKQLSELAVRTTDGEGEAEGEGQTSRQSIPLPEKKTMPPPVQDDARSHGPSVDVVEEAPVAKAPDPPNDRRRTTAASSTSGNNEDLYVDSTKPTVGDLVIPEEIPLPGILTSGMEPEAEVTPGITPGEGEAPGSVPIRKSQPEQ